MKKNILLSDLEQDSTEENTCKCCEALGISDIIRSLIEEDEKKDRKKQAKK